MTAIQSADSPRANAAPSTAARTACPVEPASLGPERTPLCECVVLDVAPGVTPSKAAPVRIFLGTEDAQERAERVFVYSVERARDPARTYEIYLMKDLPGFDRKAWRTGFTNYRFAIPELAGFTGKAIYNDVDQIYLRDPAELFDLDMQDHGYLSISPKDTSVMLIDCARMAEWWSLETARTRDKKPLTNEPAAVLGLWGHLDGGWNARDMEFDPERSGVLHFTTLHLQPWQPTPEDYAYQPHPLGEVWFGLEREAEAACAQVFRADRPSRAFRARAAAPDVPAPDVPAPDVSAQAARFLADCGGPSQLHVAFRHRPPATWTGASRDLAVTPAASLGEPVDAVAATGLIRDLPSPDVRWVLDQLFRWARNAVYLRADLTALSSGAGPADGEWWREAMEAAAARYPGRNWRLELVEANGERAFESRHAASRTPRVWVLEGRHNGDNAQLAALAEALEWPWERKRLTFNALHRLPGELIGASTATLTGEARNRLQPPWPDVVIAAGKRSAPVARWIKRQSGGRTRLIHLGRPRAALDAFDLILTTPQYLLPAHSNVLHMVRALNRPSDTALSAADAAWRTELAALPSPRIGVILGGNRAPYTFTAAFAARLAERLDALATAQGGSLLLVDSPRTPAGFLDSVAAAMKAPHRAMRDQTPNHRSAYPAVLALSDAFVVTGDSASMLAEATATGKPVQMVEPPRRDEDRRNPLVSALNRLRHRTGDRGTPRQQAGLDRALTRLVARGWLKPSREMRAYTASLERHGLVQPLDGAGLPALVPAPDDFARAVAAVRKTVARARRVD